MRKIGIILFTFSIFIVAGAVIEAVIGIAAITTEGHSDYEVDMKQDLLCLIMAYPDDIIALEKRFDDKVYIRLKSGKWLIYDDKKKKTPEEKLSNPDLQDMMEQIYPLNSVTKLVEKDYDPGRVRVYTLLKEAYGDTEAEIESKLVNVRVGNGNFQFNSRNGAADSLKQVMKELNPIMVKKPSISGFFFPPDGTYNFRVIAGTGRLSPHAFGIAIDLHTNKSDYWQWATQEQGEKRLASYPSELVKVFEDNGFIWGGKWNHFDIMHFEYRPEIIFKAKYFGNKDKNKKVWYDGAPVENNKVKAYIDKIEKALIIHTV